MSIPGSALTFLGAASGGDGDYRISRSLRFNDDDNAYLNRTSSFIGNRKTWTWSGWIKRCSTGSYQAFFSSYQDSTNFHHFRFRNDEKFETRLQVSGSDKLQLITDQVFRDFSAWYHVVFAYDSTQSTASDRAKLYINGSQVTDFSTETYPSQNDDSYVTNTTTHYIGQRGDSNLYHNGYLADIHLVDGQALAATDFGGFDPDTGVWNPNEYTGTHGTNGFHLDFSDNSSPAALGNDAAGSNDWTVENIASPPAGNFDLTTASLNPSGGASYANGRDELSMAFDGSTDSYLLLSDQNNHGISFSPGISVSSKVEIWGLTSNQYASTNLVGSNIAYTPGQWTTLFNGSGTLTDITMISNNNRPGLAGIRIDGVELISNTLDTDSFIDSPTNYRASSGNNGGNYATLNPLATVSGLTLSNGNLDATGNVVQGCSLSTIFPSSGKYYAEFTLNTYHADTAVGVVSTDVDHNQDWVGEQAYTVGYLADGRLFQNSSSTNIGAYAAGDTIGIAFDVDTGKIWFSKNGTFINSGNPGAGTGELKTITGGKPLGIAFRGVGAGAGTLNFGQRPFAYTPPTGFKSLCTTNLDDPLIADGSAYFEAKTYAGNSGTQTISLPFSPDLVWVKGINNAYDHELATTVQPLNGGLASNIPDQEFTSNIEPGTDSFYLDGQSDYTNAGGINYISWNWNAGENSNKTYNVTVVNDSGNKYRFDGYGTSAVTLDLEEGSTYVFDQSDSSNSGHPLRFSTTSDGTHGGGSEYTTGVTTTGTPGSAGASTTIVVASGAPTLYYYCSVHSGMGGQADTNSTAGASNFDGSIQSTVRANPAAGFSIVSYTGTGSNATIGHELNAQPHMVVFKNRDTTNDWVVIHKNLTGYGTHRMHLNTTAAESSAGASWFQSTAPTSSVISVGNISDVNGNGNNIIAYCFASVEGYSAFGSYTANGNTDGPFVYTGFQVRWLLTKRSDQTENWNIHDTTRSPYNAADEILWASLSNAQLVDNTNRGIDFLSNGFKLRGNDTGINSGNNTYIYAAFAEHPFKYARAR